MLTAARWKSGMTPYFDAMGGIWSEDDMLLGYQTTLALTGASRLHWMLAK